MPRPPVVVAVHALAQRRGEGRDLRLPLEGYRARRHYSREEGEGTTGVGIPPVLEVLVESPFTTKKKNKISIFP
jgi:hypothetical protein